MIKDKISIIIPTYNRASIITKALDSICAQHYQYWSCYIVDDHSTDNTKDIIKKYTEKDSRFIYLVNSRKKGAQGARNTGLYNCDSEWVYFFDSDNTMHPDCLSSLVEAINDKVDVIQCFSRIISVSTGDTGKEFNWKSVGNIHDQLFEGTTYVDFNHSIIRRIKLLEINGLDEDCPSMQEWDSHIRLSVIANYTTVEKTLIDYYVEGKDAISTDTRREINGRIYILRKHIKEWNERPKAMHKFVYQINNLIKRNENTEFKLAAYVCMNEIVKSVNYHLFLYKIDRIINLLSLRYIKKKLYDTISFIERCYCTSWDRD